MTIHVPTLQRSLPDIVEEYETKKANLEAALATVINAGKDLETAATVAGTYGNTTVSINTPAMHALEHSLLISAWKHVYDGLQIERLASPDEKRKWKYALEKPEPFNLGNIRGTFEKYLLDPRGSILRGLAEVFCGLDDFYKSHDKVKIGVAGLPKRVILSSVTAYSSWGKEKLTAVINALATYQGKPLVEHIEIEALLKDETALLNDGELTNWKGEKIRIYGRGIRLRTFANGNGHLYFEPQTLKDINRALAEFYGDVLPDCAEAKPEHKQASTAVSKDLQFYATPRKVVDRILDDLYKIEGKHVLEPSCGEGAFLDGLRKRKATCYGIEVDAGRVEICRAKGHRVLQGNFLDVVPSPKFDLVVMNPPFYGKHYAKHVEHAMKFLKPGGMLVAILPVTARYDHGLVDGKWDDLPVGSFSDSGTNINTTVLTKHAQTA